MGDAPTHLPAPCSYPCHQCHCWGPRHQPGQSHHQLLRSEGHRLMSLQNKSKCKSVKKMVTVNWEGNNWKIKANWLVSWLMYCGMFWFLCRLVLSSFHTVYFIYIHNVHFHCYCFVVFSQSLLSCCYKLYTVTTVIVCWVHSQNAGDLQSVLCLNASRVDTGLNCCCC